MFVLQWNVDIVLRMSNTLETVDKQQQKGVAAPQLDLTKCPNYYFVYFVFYSFSFL